MMDATRFNHRRGLCDYVPTAADNQDERNPPPSPFEQKLADREGHRVADVLPFAPRPSPHMANQDIPWRWWFKSDPNPTE